MARSRDLDPLFTSDFALLDIGVNVPISPLAFPIKQGLQIAREGISFISFAGISLPEVELEVKDIQELAYPFNRAVATGGAVVGNAILRQAVVPLGFDFYFWMYQALYGVAGPRRNLYVLHLDKGKKKIRRTYYLEGCIPISWIPSGDLDAASPEVSIEELTINVERVELDFADPT